jgi:GTPase
MFIDEVTIHVCSGRGGDGMSHFHREKFVAKGGPDGGDGGKGGNIILLATPHMNTLYTFQHQAKFRAEDGKNGSINDRTGHDGADLIIKIPMGTIIYDDETHQVLGDLVEEGQQLIVCKGGKGGYGNPHFKNSRDQAPRTAERGEPSEAKTLRMELKLIADVGIVGMPNAGKSSFLAAVSNATPKIANYPFTTLEPNLGVSYLDDENQLILADIPGLIEGAHLGAGLGYAFLRHIQRCRILIHMVDGASPDPLSDYSQINSELALFDPHLAEKPQIVVINKIDMPEVQEKLKSLKAAFKKKGAAVMAVSALARTDLKPVLWKAVELLATTPVPEKTTEIPVYKSDVDARAFEIVRVEDGWQVTGKSIERAAAMTYWEMEESVRRFQRLMEHLGVDDALRKAGITEGETVYVGENELEWQD